LLLALETAHPLPAVKPDATVKLTIAMFSFPFETKAGTALHAVVVAW
jgi:hypothetical protein